MFIYIYIWARTMVYVCWATDGSATRDFELLSIIQSSIKRKSDEKEM